MRLKEQILLIAEHAFNCLDCHGKTIIVEKFKILLILMGGDFFKNFPK